MFCSLTHAAVGKMLDFAIELHGESLIDDHIKSATKGAKTPNSVRTEPLTGGLSEETQVILRKAARTKKAGWFKSVSWMEEVTREIVGPDLAGDGVDEGFSAILTDLFAWADHG